MGDKAKIFNRAMPIDVVVFDLNPEQMSVMYQNVLSSRPQIAAGGGSTGSPLPGQGGPAGYAGNQYQGNKATTLRFKALLDADHGGASAISPTGADSVRRRVDMLFAWTKPGASSLLGAMAGMAVTALSGGKINLLAIPTLLTFQWGDPLRGGYLMNGFLTQVQANYTRFTDAGNPTRAEVTVTFKEEPDSLLNMLTNPTSGGLPGRRAHVVAEGENLQTIATAAYGRPGLWRQIADCNGIDDPMRLPPGTTVYLPAPAELELTR